MNSLPMVPTGMYSAADLARLTGVSKSTVSRLFKRLGFESYRTVKDHARQLRNLGVPLVIDAHAMEEERESGTSFQRHLQREQENLQRCFASLVPQEFAAMVEALAKSSRWSRSSSLLVTTSCSVLCLKG